MKILLIAILINFAYSQEFDISNPIEAFSIPLARYFLKFAGIGYCTYENVINQMCCHDFISQENWELVLAEKISIHDYNFTILLNKEFNKVVIALPGTRGIQQFISETLDQNGVSILNNDIIKVMIYFEKIYSNIKEKMQAKLKELTLIYPDYQYIFVGHSLGGAMASIVSLDSISSDSIKKNINSPILITYGQPRTGNDIFANEVMKNIPKIFRIVREGDPIVSMPICSVRNLFLNTDCKTILPNSKFDNNLSPKEEQIKLETDEFLSWHIGGLKLFNEDMTEYTDCGGEYGENNINKKCQMQISINIHKHTQYFNERIRHMCNKL